MLVWYFEGPVPSRNLKFWNGSLRRVQTVIWAGAPDRFGGTRESAMVALKGQDPQESG